MAYITKGLRDAVGARVSRRKYLPEALSAEHTEKLRALIGECGGQARLKMELVPDNGGAFKGLRKSYGMFSGVRSYVALIGHGDDALEREKLGYYGELFVLGATVLGLGTCWVGGTFSRASCPVELAEGERIVCAITVGRTPEELTAREKLLRWGTHRKTKGAERMYRADCAVPPEWFLDGMTAVQKAPSAVNRQPVMFDYTNGAVTASVKDIGGEGYALDLGIAKLHFEIGAGGGEWVFGNGGVFIPATRNF